MTRPGLSQKLKKERLLLILLILMASALFLSNLGAFKDFVRAESYFALGSRLMLHEGDWLAPHAPDEAVLNKPPLQYWLTGLAYKISGASYATARLPSALAAIITLLALYLLGNRLYNAGAGLLAAGILATSYIFYTFARTAMSDMLLTLCVTSALSCFILLLSGKSYGHERLLALCGYLFVALGVLAKGPVAILLVFGPLMIELALSRSLSLLKKLRVLEGVLVLILIAAPYFILLYLRLGAGPLYAFFVGENLQRFTGEIYQYATRPVWYLPLAFMSDFAPWSLLLFPALYLDWRERALGPDERRTRRLLYLWLFFPLLFFSFSHFKLDYYLLPAMPAAALIAGRFLVREEKLSRSLGIYTYAFTIIFALAMVAAPLISMRISAGLNIEAGFLWLAVALSAAAFSFMLYSLYKDRRTRAVWSLIFSIWIVLIFHEWTLAPALSRYQPLERLAAHLPQSGDSSIYASSKASYWANTLAFHLPTGQKVTRLTSDEDGGQLKEILAREPQAVVLLKEEEFDKLRASGLSLRVLAEGETLGHGGLTLNNFRRPSLERLKLVQLAGDARD